MLSFRNSYDNGEIETVNVRNIEPREDFGPPVVNSEICVKSRFGGKYSARIIKVLEVLCKHHLYGESLSQYIICTD